MAIRALESVSASGSEHTHSEKTERDGDKGLPRFPGGWQGKEQSSLGAPSRSTLLTHRIETFPESGRDSSARPNSTQRQLFRTPWRFSLSSPAPLDQAEHPGMFPSRCGGAIRRLDSLRGIGSFEEPIQDGEDGNEVKQESEELRPPPDHAVELSCSIFGPNCFSVLWNSLKVHVRKFKFSVKTWK